METTLLRGNLIIWGALVLMLGLTACSSSSGGWALQISAIPINQVNDQKMFISGVKSNGGAIVPVNQKERY